MFLVTIINNNVETVINSVSANKEAPRITGTVKQGINSIDSFSFTILPNNLGYNLIYPYKTLVKVLNTKTNKYEFVGRVLKSTGAMSSNGLVNKSFVCESELAYLLDTIQMYEEIHNISVKDYLAKLLQVHNSKTSKDKQFKLGNVTIIDNNDSLYRYIDYDTTKKNIDEDLIGKLGGEIKVRYKDNVRYLDYLTEVAEYKSTEIRLAKNIKDITNEIDPTNYYTRITPLGAKLKIKDASGNETDSEERLTIGSINNNIAYIDDSEAIKEFGIIEGIVTFDDVTKADILLEKGKEALLRQRIKVSNKVTALDLSLIGLSIDSFEVGNYHPLIHDLLNINYIVRIIEKSISIESPESSTITLGDKQNDIKQYQLQAKKEAEKNKKIEETIKIQNNKINAANNNINTTKEEITIEVNKQVETLNNTIKDLEKRIKLLEGGTNG